MAPAAGSAGFVKATVGGVTGQARVRVIPPLPWTYDFEGMKAAPMWWTANRQDDDRHGRRQPACSCGRATTPSAGAPRCFMGRPDWSNYTVEADVRGTETRRQRGDIGLINQRYVLVLFGNDQRLELQSLAGRRRDDGARAVRRGRSNTWYRMKLRVENRADGTTLVQGKVWPRGEPEPAKWTIEKVDRIPHRKGAPGLYGDGISDVQFDNLRVYKNQ